LEEDRPKSDKPDFQATFEDRKLSGFIMLEPGYGMSLMVPETKYIKPIILAPVFRMYTFFQRSRII
jgi:hypothetical protein